IPAPCVSSLSSLLIALVAFGWAFVMGLNAADSPPVGPTLVRSVDLDAGESQEIELANRTGVRVKLLTVDEMRDAMRSAVRQARVRVELNGQSLVVTSAT